MKRSTTISLVATIALLALAAQPFAFGGGTAGSMAGSHQMSSTMHQGQGSMMQSGPANGSGMQQGPMNGTAPLSMMPSGTGGAAGKQYGKTNGSGNGMTTMQPPATTSTK